MKVGQPKTIQVNVFETLTLTEVHQKDESYVVVQPFQKGSYLGSEPMLVFPKECEIICKGLERAYRDVGNVPCRLQPGDTICYHEELTLRRNSNDEGFSIKIPFGVGGKNHFRFFEFSNVDKSERMREFLVRFLEYCKVSVDVSVSRTYDTSNIMMEFSFVSGRLGSDAEFEEEVRHQILERMDIHWAIRGKREKA